LLLEMLAVEHHSHWRSFCFVRRRRTSPFSP
jgi:hypothetical protein